MIVRTASGSAYVLCKDTMTWGRFREHPDEPSPYPVRTKDGILLEFPEVVVGKSMTLLCPPLVEGTAARALFTSEVVEIVEEG